MEYKNRAKSRKIKRLVISSFQLLKFKWFHLTLWGKISSFGAIITIFSLFFKWIFHTTESLSGTPFTKTGGYMGYSLLLIWAFVLFLAFSFDKKEKLKLWVDLNFRDYNAIIWAGILNTILSLHSFVFISWLQAFSSEISIGKWPVISIVWWILISIGGFILKREAKFDNRSVIINDINYKEKDEHSQENMKLPF